MPARLDQAPPGGLRVYRGEFRTKMNPRDGPARVVVGLTGETLEARRAEYAAKGQRCPAFAKPAAAPFPLVKLADVATLRQGYRGGREPRTTNPAGRYLAELCHFGRECQASPSTWRECCRGACFALPSWYKWPDDHRRACLRLFAELPAHGPAVSVAARALVRELAAECSAVRWHLAGACFLCGGEDHAARDCPKPKPGEAPRGARLCKVAHFPISMRGTCGTNEPQETAFKSGQSLRAIAS